MTVVASMKYPPQILQVMCGLRACSSPLPFSAVMVAICNSEERKQDRQ